MTTKRLYGLMLLSIHLYERLVNYDAVVQRFTEQPRRKLLIDPVFDEAEV